MIIGPDFVLVGMPKCGCIFSKYMLQKAGLIREFLGHTPLAEIPESKRAGKQLIGMVRNPFAWYVSRYTDWSLHYNKQGEKIDFPAWLRKYIFDPKSKPMMSVCRNFPDAAVKIGTFTYTHVCFHFEQAAMLLPSWSVRDYEVQYHTFLSCDTMLRTETLTRDAPKVYGPSVNCGLNSPHNSNPHKPYQEYYDAELREIVEEADAVIFSKYGYKFQDT